MWSKFVSPDNPQVKSCFLKLSITLLCVCMCVWDRLWEILQLVCGWCRQEPNWERERQKEGESESFSEQTTSAAWYQMHYLMIGSLATKADRSPPEIDFCLDVTLMLTHTQEEWNRKPVETNYQFTECLRRLNLSENTWRTGRPATRDKINWEIIVLLLEWKCT